MMVVLQLRIPPSFSIPLLPSRWLIVTEFETQTNTPAFVLSSSLVTDCMSLEESDLDELN